MGSIEAKYWDATRKRLKVPRGKDALKVNNLDTALMNEMVRLKKLWAQLNHLQGDFTADDFKGYVAGDLDPV